MKKSDIINSESFNNLKNYKVFKKRSTDLFPCIELTNWHYKIIPSYKLILYGNNGEKNIVTSQVLHVKEDIIHTINTPYKLKGNMNHNCNPFPGMDPQLFSGGIPENFSDKIRDQIKSLENLNKLNKSNNNPMNEINESKNIYENYEHVEEDEKKSNEGLQDKAKENNSFITKDEKRTGNTEKKIISDDLMHKERSEPNLQGLFKYKEVSTEEIVKIDGLSHKFSKNNDYDLSEKCEEHKHKVNNDLVINNFNESNVLNEEENIYKQDKDDIREEVNKEYCIEDFENVVNLNTNNIQSEEEMIQDSLYPKNEEIPGILREEQTSNEEKLLQTSSDTKNDLNTNEELHYPILEERIVDQEHELNDENLSNASEINEENKCPTPGYVEESECLTDAFELPHENKIHYDSNSKSKAGFDLTNIGTIQDSICTKKTEEASNIHMSENVKRKIDELISLETKEKKTVDDFLFNKTLQIPVNVSEISYDSSEKSDDKTMQEINLLSQEMKHETDKFIEFFKEAKEQMLTSVNMNNIEGNVKSNEEREKEKSGSLQEEKNSTVKRVKIKAQANKKLNAVKNELELEKIVKTDDENRKEINVSEKNKITKRKVKQFGKESDEPVNKEVLNDEKINSKESKKAKSKVEKKKEVLENKNTLIKKNLINKNKKISHTSVVEDKLPKKSLSTDSKKVPKKKRKKLTLPRKFK